MTNKTPDSEELEALFNSVAASNEIQNQQHSQQGHSQDPDKVISHIGHLTRKLHETLKQLGYDKNLEKALAAIPDTRDRLSYIANLTEQSAHRTLAAIDIAKPIQEKLAHNAQTLSNQWKNMLENRLGIEEFKSLVQNTYHYLNEIPTQSKQTNQQLLEIMMAQEFQDLTGQVISKIIEMAKDVEARLLEVLVEYSRIHNEADSNNKLLNGPVINSKNRPDVVTNQAQVDELLESLGF